MNNWENLVAWAVTNGYDPEHDYSADIDRQTAPAEDGQLSANFHEDEFRCKCCGGLPEDGMSPDLIDGLERIRARYGKAVHINSGYRCPDHNRAVGGATNSRHLYGDAADFWMDGEDSREVYNDIDPLHQTGGLGSYSTFTHIDFRGTKARWSG